MKRYGLWALFLLVSVAVSFALHHDVLGLAFFADDWHFIYRCNNLSPSDFLAQFHPILTAWYYRPSFLVYWWASLQLFGPDPVALHALGLIIHAANITLLAALVYRIRRSVPLAVLCAALAFIWPGQRDKLGALDWVAAHSALLALFFSLAALHLWINFRASGSRWVYAGALACFWLALTSKQDAFSLPLLLLIFDCLLCRRDDVKTWWERWRPVVPFAAVFVACLVLNVIAYRYYYSISPATREFIALPLPDRVALIPRIFNALLLRSLYFDIGSTALIYGLTAVIIAALGFALRRDRGALAFYLASMAAVLPMPLAIAQEALQPRFLYFPMLIVAAMAGVLVSTNWAGRIVAALVGWSLLEIYAPEIVGMALWLPTQPAVWLMAVVTGAAWCWLRRRPISSAASRYPTATEASH